MHNQQFISAIRQALANIERDGTAFATLQACSTISFCAERLATEAHAEFFKPRTGELAAKIDRESSQ